MSVHETLLERTSTVVAAGAAASPWWLPSMQEASGFAGQMVPILGALWLLIQITAWVIKQLRQWRGQPPA